MASPRWFESPESRKRAFKVWRLHRDGVSGVDIAAKLKLDPAMVSRDLTRMKEMFETLSKEMAPPDQEFAKNIDTIFENTVASMKAQLDEALRSDRSTWGLRRQMVSVMVTGLTAIDRLLEEGERKQEEQAVEALAKGERSISSPVQAYVDELLSRKRLPGGSKGG